MFLPNQNLDPKSPNNLGIAYRLGAEFISGILIGLLIGYFFDKTLGTTPWGLVIFIVLGMGAGLLNVIRAFNQINNQSDQGKQKGEDSND